MERVYTGIDFGSHSIYVTTTRGTTGYHCCSAMASVMNCFKHDRKIQHAFALNIMCRSVMGIYKNIIYACDGGLFYVCFNAILMIYSSN